MLKHDAALGMGAVGRGLSIWTQEFLPTLS